MKPDISIVVVNWKVRKLLEKCLQSIRKYKGDLNVEIFVVDNDSHDSTPEMIMAEYPNVTMISLAHNIGFAKANNLAIKQSSADYILLLNPDAEITENFLTNTLKYLKDHPEVGILGPKILNPDGSLQRSVRRFPDLLSQILVLFKLKKVLVNNTILDKYLSRNLDYNKEQSVAQVMGAAMLITRKVINDIGLLDEHFFIWFEEVDYCQRARDAGYDIKYYPNAEVIHQLGARYTK